MIRFTIRLQYDIQSTMKLITEKELPPRCRDCRHFSSDRSAPLPYTCQALGYQGKMPPSKLLFVNGRPECDCYQPGD